MQRKYTYEEMCQVYNCRQHARVENATTAAGVAAYQIAGDGAVVKKQCATGIDKNAAGSTGNRQTRDCNNVGSNGRSSEDAEKITGRCVAPDAQQISAGAADRQILVNHQPSARQRDRRDARCEVDRIVRRRRGNRLTQRAIRSRTCPARVGVARHRKSRGISRDSQKDGNASGE